MGHMEREPSKSELINELDHLREQIETLRERIEAAHNEDRRHESRPYPWPDRRKTAA